MLNTRRKYLVHPQSFSLPIHLRTVANSCIIKNKIQKSFEIKDLTNTPIWVNINASARRRILLPLLRDPVLCEYSMIFLFIPLYISLTGCHLLSILSIFVPCPYLQWNVHAPWTVTPEWSVITSKEQNVTGRQTRWALQYSVHGEPNSGLNEAPCTYSSIHR